MSNSWSSPAIIIIILSISDCLSFYSIAPPSLSPLLSLSPISYHSFLLSHTITLSFPLSPSQTLTPPLPYLTTPFFSPTLSLSPSHILLHFSSLPPSFLPTSFFHHTLSFHQLSLLPTLILSLSLHHYRALHQREYILSLRETDHTDGDRHGAGAAERLTREMERLTREMERLTRAAERAGMLCCVR